MTIICGDCLAEMRKMEDNSIDLIVTDPPYGLHFMGKKWDYQVPSIEIWKEALRILKPGGMAAIFGGSRTYHRMAVNVEDAGFEIRDSIIYMYGTGFPKSHNFGCKCKGDPQDRRGETCPNCKGVIGFQGFGSNLKPAYEPILLAMKPLDGTFAQNAEKWGLAGINIDASRVETKENLQRPNAHSGLYEGGFKKMEETNKPLARWPANIIFDEDAAHQLDQQSGVLKSGAHNGVLGKPGYESGFLPKFSNRSADSGGASRFFYCAKASTSERNAGLEGMRLKNRKSSSGNNRTRHCTDCKLTDNGKNDHSKCKGKIANDISKPNRNTHPTVKPLSLMRYIIKLLAPPGYPILLDPFCGSGSTCVAAESLGIRSIGIDLSEEYCEIARKRIEHQKQLPKQMDLFDSKAQKPHTSPNQETPNEMPTSTQ